MSSKIEIRKLAELACGTSKDSPEYSRFLEAINPTLMLDLTAPVVERRSVGHISLKQAPPELAELQATIARQAELLMRANSFVPQLDPLRSIINASLMEHLIRAWS